MTTRTAAAKAAPLPSDDPTRRATAGAAAVLAAMGPPEANAAEHPDAALLALREPWLAARAAYAAETPQRSAEYAVALTALPPVPSHYDDPDGASAAIRARCAALDEIEAAHPQETITPEAEARQDEALAEEGRIIDAIAALPALTLAGIGFKAEVSRLADHMEPRLVASTMTDMVALAGGTAAAQRKVTFEDYAGSTFEACTTPEDVEELRPAFERHFTPLHFAISILTKDSNEMTEMVEAIMAKGNDRLVATLSDSIRDTAQWFRQTADLMDSAEIRILCGACQAAAKRGGI